ncbi:MAG TPA: hypothetical protein VF861_11655 [Telluria sp.]
MMGLLLNKIDHFRALRVRHMSRYRVAMADIPPTLYPYWKRTAHFEFKGIPQDAFFFARAADGLLAFFDCVRSSDRACALPSMAADSVWHAWIRLAPDGIDAFCLKHFGRTISHIERAAMAVPMAEALANCLVRARALESLPTARVGVPRLFALDLKLRMPGGLVYTRFGGRLAWERLDRAGRRRAEFVFRDQFEPALLDTGLIWQAELADCTGHTAGDGGGGGADASSGACDGGGGDSGGSCGGGCGGGGGD